MNFQKDNIQNKVNRQKAKHVKEWLLVIPGFSCCKWLSNLCSSKRNSNHETVDIEVIEPFLISWSLGITMSDIFKAKATVQILTRQPSKNHFALPVYALCFITKTLLQNCSKTEALKQIMNSASSHFFNALCFKHVK